MAIARLLEGNKKDGYHKWSRHEVLERNPPPYFMVSEVIEPVVVPLLAGPIPMEMRTKRYLYSHVGGGGDWIYLEDGCDG